MVHSSLLLRVHLNVAPFFLNEHVDLLFSVLNVVVDQFSRHADVDLQQGRSELRIRADRLLLSNLTQHLVHSGANRKIQ